MKFRSIFKLVPNWAVLLATDLRCLLRCSVVCRRIAFQKPSGNSALIVAPHPDDETFGCGGLIRLKSAAGVPVHVVILTDGEAVAVGLGEDPQKVISARKSETLNACQRLGLEADSVSWLHLPDGKMPHPGQPGFAEAARALHAEMELLAPQEVYCPHAQDVHPDHLAATRLTEEAVRLSSRPCSLYYYPVWMWYHASSGLRKRLDTAGAWRLDISAALSAKNHAMAAYLDAPKAPGGKPYCGRLPWSFLQNFRRRYEVYFPATSSYL
ncbi:MAG: PIG-L family deacetylase [Verrucomicrobia bacterium]|nr:PIG-L family deacetylase [Verrucomicrobiota bacterium]